MMTPRPTTEHPASAPTPPTSLLQRPARTIAHAVPILLIAPVVAPFVADHPLPALLIQYARPAMFIPFAVGVAGGLNADRITLTILAAAIVLTTWPDKMIPYAIASIIGIVLGTSIRGLIIREHHNNG